MKEEATEPQLTARIRLMLANDDVLDRNGRRLARAHIAARDACERCGGSGEGPLASEHDCEWCNGAGFLPRSSDQLGAELKNWWEELALAGQCSNLQQQIFSAVFDLVDWSRLADEYIREELES